MENGLLYTFSTIAQALGGAFALLSAFVLFYFQALQKNMAEDAETLADNWMGPNRRMIYRTLISNADYYGVLQNADEQLVEYQGKPEAQHVSTIWQNALNRLRQSVNRRRAVLAKFKRSAFTTGLVMIGSVVLIPLAHPIHCVVWLACTALVIGIGGFALCLFQYWFLIRVAVFEVWNKPVVYDA
jgi:hypothetical protein